LKRQSKSKRIQLKKNIKVEKNKAEKIRTEKAKAGKTKTEKAKAEKAKAEISRKKPSEVTSRSRSTPIQKKVTEVLRDDVLVSSSKDGLSPETRSLPRHQGSRRFIP
jgi:membrane protein involved in colicin uptake